MVKIRRPTFDQPASSTTVNANGSNETIGVNGATPAAVAAGAETNAANVAMEIDTETTPSPPTKVSSTSAIETSPTAMEVDGTGTSSTSTSEEAVSSNTRPKSGPRPISMDAYQQLQQKRLREQQTATTTDSSSSQKTTTPALLNPPAVQQFQVPSILDPSSSLLSSPTTKAKAEESADALAHIQQLVSQIPALASNQTATVAAGAPAVVGQSSDGAQTITGTAALPGPDLTRIIFAGAAAKAAETTVGGQSYITASDSTTTSSNGSSHHPKIPNGGSAQHGSQHHKTISSSSSSSSHRRSLTTTSGSGATSSSQSASNAQSSSSSSSANPRQPHKGPRAIHAIELIRIAGEILQLPPTTVGTALIYYHKYRAYLHQALRRGDRDNEAFKADEYLFATACLHLACKCTEVSRKVRDLVNVTYRVMNPSQPVLSLSTKPGAEEAEAAAAVERAIAAAKASQARAGASSSSTSGERGGDGSQPPPQQAPQHTFPVFPNAPPPTVTTYWHIRDSLLTTELMLLRILQFDLDVPLPFNDLLRTFKGMGSIFEPTEDEAAHLYPNASSFEVFLPNLIKPRHHHGHDRNQSPKVPPGTANSPSGPNSTNITTVSPSSSASSPHVAGPPTPFSANSGSLEPHPGIHPALSAMVQMAMTFCIDALCSSAIALHYSSKAMALGATYLAIRAVGLELPMPFEEWCYAWGRPSVLQAIGVDPQQHQHHHPFSNGRGGTAGGGGAGSIANGGAGSPRTGAAVSGGTALITPGDMEMNAASTSTVAGAGNSSSSHSHLSATTLFAPPPPGSLKRQQQQVAGSDGGAPTSSKTASPSSLSDPQQSSAAATAATGSSPRQPPAPLTIVEEVQRVVQELTNFYTH